MERPYRREEENWFDDAFVVDWLARQEGRSAERRRQFAMVRSLIPRTPEEDFRYVEVGCGDGALAETILERFPRVHATLVDGSPAMLQKAGERLARFGSRLTLARGDLSAPCWAEAVSPPFDVAASTIALHNLEDPARVRALYGEVWTIVAEGGFFMNLDYMRAPHPALSLLYRLASADPESGFMRVRGYRDYVGTVDEHLGWLAEAGFAPKDCFWMETRLALVGGFKGPVRIPELG